MDYSLVNLWNPGVLSARLPPDLYQSLKHNCLSDFVKEKYSHNSIAHISKVLRYPHDQDQQLNDFLCDTFNEYHKVFNFDRHFMSKHEPKLHDMWVNYQKKNEYVPNHRHAGHVSFVIWVQIPYDLKKELETDFETRRDNAPQKAAFEFVYNTINSDVVPHTILVNKEDEGRMLMFPSSLFHCVYPFTTSNGVRISVSGNMLLQRRD